MSDYTPTTEEVRDRYEEAKCYDYGISVAHFGAEFHRWLASVKADAWDEGPDAEYAVWNYGAHCQKNPYRGEQA